MLLHTRRVKPPPGTSRTSLRASGALNQLSEPDLTCWIPEGLVDTAEAGCLRVLVGDLPSQDGQQGTEVQGAQGPVQPPGRAVQLQHGPLQVGHVLQELDALQLDAEVLRLLLHDRQQVRSALREGHLLYQGSVALVQSGRPVVVRDVAEPASRAVVAGAGRDVEAGPHADVGMPNASRVAGARRAAGRRGHPERWRGRRATGA
mmetsp:Transcript_120418/g.376780  ORF Transcript_120418/g.376780 Transcript_120418/m.376780 type:complete len:204 (+) Transcript_120418:126-737(+)